MKPKLADIPIELQSHILDNLSTPSLSFSKPPSDCTLSSLECAYEDFSDDMLHAAQTSGSLSKAMISNLGSHAKFLNFYRSARLSEWIFLLRNHVKGFSLEGAIDLRHCDSGCAAECQCDNLHRCILKALQTLCIDNIALEVLNIEGLAITDTGRAEQLAMYVSNVMQRSSSSLREISLHTNWASAMALQLVTLPNLEVAQISLFNSDADLHPEFSGAENGSKTLCDILKGLNGHANRNKSTISLRELRLHGIRQAPLIDRNSCSNLFSAVQELTLSSISNSEQSGIAEFAANFQNLKTFVWRTGSICAEDMNTIFSGCPNLSNLEIFIGNRGILPEEIPVAQFSPRLNELFVSFRGKLTELNLRTCLLSSQIKILGDCSPNLEILQMEIDSTNISGLASLLGTHCRKLHTLRLNYSHTAMECLGRKGWPALAKAISKASNELRVLTIKVDQTLPILETAPLQMVEAIIDILEFMGDRASTIEFMVPINTQDPFVVMNAIWRTLNVAKTHCGSIQILCLDFISDFNHGGYRVHLEHEDRLMNTFCTIHDLENQVYLRQGIDVELGDTDTLWQIPE